MPNILNFIRTLLVNVLKGTNTITTMAAPVAQDYLALLVRLAWKGTFTPLIIAVIGILGGMMTEWNPKIWSNMIALAGIMGFLFLGLLGALATPIGALIGAALPAGQAPSRTQPLKVTWGTVFSPDWIVKLIRGTGQWASDQLREGVTRYFSLVRKVLAWEVCIFFFVAAMPSLRSTTFVLILGAMVIAVSSKYLSEGWARAVRVATIILMALWILGGVFPALNPFTYIFGKSAETLTSGSVVERGKLLQHWIDGNWNTPTFAVLVILLCAATYGAIRVGRRIVRYVLGTTSAAGGSPNASATGSAHGSGGGGSGKMGWLWMTAVCAVIVCALGMLALKVLAFHKGRGDQIEDNMARARLYNIAQDAARTTINAAADMKAANQRLAAAAAQRPPAAPAPSAPTPEIWSGLRSPRKYVFQFTPEWSQRIEKPYGLSMRTSPEYICPEIRINGKEILRRIPGKTTPFPSYTEFMELRRTNGMRDIEITVGVGMEAN